MTSSSSPVNSVLIPAEPAPSKSPHGPPDGSWAPLTAPGQTGPIRTQLPKPRPIVKPTTPPPAPQEPLVRLPMVIDPALLDDGINMPSMDENIPAGISTPTPTSVPILPTNSAIFPSVPHRRPTTPPPAPSPASNSPRSPLGPRQPMQSMSSHPPLLSLFPTRPHAQEEQPPPSSEPSHPPLLSLFPTRPHAQDEQPPPSGEPSHPQASGPVELEKTELPDLETSVDRRILPVKMSRLYDLFVEGKGAWGEGWAGCIESFVTVEGFDGSPVRGLKYALPSPLIVSFRLKPKALDFHPSYDQSNSVCGSRTAVLMRTVRLKT